MSPRIFLLTAVFSISACDLSEAVQPLPDAEDPPTSMLAEEYPGDIGLGSDPSVVWFEDFEEGSLSAIAARYDQSRDNGRWSLVTDSPNGTGWALAMRAGQAQQAVDLYKRLPDGNEWWVRWYARCCRCCVPPAAPR